MSNAVDVDSVLPRQRTLDLTPVPEPNPEPTTTATEEPTTTPTTEPTTPSTQKQTPEVPPIVKTIVDTVLKRFGDRTVNPQTLMTLVKYTMEVVEATKMKGSEQREMVINVVEKIVRDAPISDEREKLCLDMISSGVLGQTIDLVVDATNGHLNVNNVFTVAENCCFSFLSARRNRRNQRNQ